jgi:ribosomal protein S8
MKSSGLYNVLNQINAAIITRSFSVQLQVNKMALQLIKILYRNHIIRFYKIVYCSQHLQHQQRPQGRVLLIKINPFIRKQLYIWSKPGKRIYLKIGQLLVLHKTLNKIRGHMLFVSSPKGIISSSEALQLKCGGEIICSF